MFKNTLPLIAACFLFSSFANLEDSSFTDSEDSSWINSEITYTIYNRSDKSWEGNILSYITDTDNLTDAYSIHSQAIQISPKAQITKSLDVRRSNILSTKDNIYIELTDTDAWFVSETISWTNLVDMSYPGLKEITSIQCTINSDGDNLNCITQ